jgi:hypothetical protein
MLGVDTLLIWLLALRITQIYALLSAPFIAFQECFELATSVYCGFMAYRQHMIDRKWQDYAVSRNAHLHWRL